MVFDRWPEGEAPFKEWLSKNSSEVLRDIGIREGQTVLDYGCNSGTFAIPAARIVGHNGKVYALDTNSKALDSLRKKTNEKALTNIEIVLVREKQDPISPLSEKADAILLYDVLQLIDDKSSLLRKLHAMLKDDGFLSVFPMHVGAQETLRIAKQSGLFVLRDRYGMLLNLEVSH